MVGLDRPTVGRENCAFRSDFVSIAWPNHPNGLTLMVGYVGGSSHNRAKSCVTRVFSAFSSTWLLGERQIRTYHPHPTPLRILKRQYSSRSRIRKNSGAARTARILANPATRIVNDVDPHPALSLAIPAVRGRERVQSTKAQPGAGGLAERTGLSPSPSVRRARGTVDQVSATAWFMRWQARVCDPRIQLATTQKAVALFARPLASLG